jgi:hypothetical protein
LFGISLVAALVSMLATRTGGSSKTRASVGRFCMVAAGDAFLAGVTYTVFFATVG